MENPFEAVKALNALLNNKILLFKGIYTITVEQKKDIEANEALNIEELISKKQVFIDKVDAIDKAFAEKSEALKKAMGIESFANIDVSRYPFFKETKLKVEEVLAIAGQIMKLEEENKAKLLVIYNRLKTDIKQVHAGKKSLRAYEPPTVNTDGIYIDRKK